ncbi:MAG: hypothetical protein H0W70_12570 [Actinobacteria bacterium]|nr:hypothetical protein [Actinomycetota bacterium]
MRGRLGAPLGSALAVVVLIGVMLGVTGGFSLSLVLVIAVLAAVLWAIGRRAGRRQGDTQWNRGAEAPLAPAQSPSRGGVVGALGRVEVRELILSPAFGAGVGLAGLIIVVFAVLSPHDVDNSWPLLFSLLPLAVHPFVGLMVVAAHFGVTRARRHGCDELFDSCPVDRGARLSAHLATAWLPAVLAVAFALLFPALISLGNDGLYGSIHFAAWLDVITCGALAAGGVALGVALGRWAPWTLSPFAALFAVFALDSAIGGGGRWAPRHYLATFDPSNRVDLLFLHPRPGARLLWLGSLAVLVAAAALFRDRRTVALRVGGGALAFAVFAAVLVVRPIPAARAENIAALLRDPAAHQTCVSAGNGVEACAYDEYADHATRVADEVRPVAAAVPAGVLNGVRFMQLYTKGVHSLPGEVAAALYGTEPANPAGVLRLRFNSTPDSFRTARLRLAARAVGAPTEPGPGGLPQVIAGQARGVVLLWLAGRGMGARADKLARSDYAGRSRPGDRVGGDATARGMAWSGACYGENGPVVWAPQDLEAARRLFAADTATVQAAVSANWARFVDPGTATNELLATVGVAPVGPAEHVEARRYTC